jgi:Na+-translocating ferredoxin:NAD+ oxidoreductase subunit B
MAMDVYQKLAHHLDDLPGGFPTTESGGELRILRRLFTHEDAELALHLTLLAEEPRVIARRAGIPPDEAARRLEAMEEKGLLYGLHSPGKAPRYMASQFAVGIWEYQLNRLNPGLIHDVDEYLPDLLVPEIWQKAPQLRTIPIGEAVPAQAEVLAYERAEELVRSHRHFTVAPCICRRERRLVGEGCNKPLETCLSFGGAADFYQRRGLGRAISQQEALDILQQAEHAGLVLQPGNSQKATFICACCGCCCGVLRTLKRQPQPARLVSSPFVAALTPHACLGCGICTDRCQMEALQMVDDKAVLDLDRCIGCGLCVTTCPGHALALVRKPEAEQPHVPKNIVATTLQLARVRGKMGTGEMIGMVVQSAVDRLLAPR